MMIHDNLNDTLLTRLLSFILALCTIISINVSTAHAEASLNTDSSVEHPLEPPDTSSPRATLFNFIKHANDGWNNYLDRGRTRQSTVVRRGFRYFDLSETPVAQREEDTIRVAILLLDVLNRIPLPAPEDVPDAAAVKRDQLTRWTIPHTVITIARVAEGHRAGEWIFTPEVVKNVKEYYLLTRHLPLKSDAVIEDGFQFYQAAPGGLFDWVRSLPRWTHKIYFEQTIWQWAMLIFFLGILGLLTKTTLLWSRRAVPDQPLAMWRKLAGPVTLMLVADFMLYLVDNQINITGVLDDLLEFLINTIFYFAVAWSGVLVMHLITCAINTSSWGNRHDLNTSLVRIIMRLLTFLVVILIAGFWLNSLGIPVLTIIAGFGIGGIAVALAAQRTIENFFGTITLFADQPVKVGDFIRFGDKMGTVESIGLRSSRIRTPERTILTVPNAEFSRMQLDNLAHRDRLLFQTKLNLRLETTNEQLQCVLNKVRELLLTHNMIDKESARIRLVAIGPHSLDLEIWSYIKTNDWIEYLAIREELFMKTLHKIEEAGTALAPPAQTSYVHEVTPQQIRA